MCSTVKIGDVICKTVNELDDAIGGMLSIDMRYAGQMIELTQCLCCIDIEETAEIHGMTAEFDHARGEWELKKP